MRKTLLRLVLVCAAIAVTGLQLHAQTTTVQGRVFDAYTGEALPYVNVVLGSGSNGTMTDADGRYAISTEDRPGRLRLDGHSGVLAATLQVARSVFLILHITMICEMRQWSKAEGRSQEQKPRAMVESESRKRITMIFALTN